MQLMASDSAPVPAAPEGRGSLIRRGPKYYENREKDLTMSWRAWLWERYARYWYLLGCLLLDLVVAGTVLQVFIASAIEAWQVGLAIVLVLALAYPEYLGYERLWPPSPLE